jgi:hypothetical protein
MDGDSSTTDASQLGISADYIGGSHYVIQPHDGKATARATPTSVPSRASVHWNLNEPALVEQAYNPLLFGRLRRKGYKFRTGLTKFVRPFIKIRSKGQMCWCTVLISELRRQRQADL